MKRKILAAALCLLLTTAAAGTASGQAVTATQPYGAVAATAKDETVYLNLDSAGKLTDIDVVNRLETPQNGVYTDHGSYEQITNLTNDSKPEIKGSAIAWKLDADPDGFYYQGKLKQGQPPFQFTVTYALDGKQMPPAELAGKSGKISVHIEAKPNGAAATYFTKHYFCQIQAALDLDKCRNLAAPGATGILSGRSQSIGFTVLPGKEAQYDITFETDSFSFDGFTITAMPFSQKSMTGIDMGDFKQDIQKMSDGTQELVDGTKKLKDGLGKLSDGIGDLRDGASRAKSGVTKYRSGVKSYTGGVSQLSSKAKQISAALKKLADNGQSLKSGYAQLNGALDTVLTQLTPAAPPEMAGQIAALRGQLSAYQQGLDAYIAGVSDLSAGMSAFSAGLDKLGDSGPSLVSGLNSIVSGMGKLADGLGKTATEMNKLPGEVGKLVDGQTELKNGVDEASDTFDQWDFGGDGDASPVSFVSTENKPRSVQFIYKTAEIGGETDKAESPAPQQGEKSFLQKLADLFR